MVVPVGTLVEKVVITQVQANVVKDTPLCSQGQQGGSILSHAGTIHIFVGGLNDRCLLQRGVVLHAHAGLELIFCSKVKGTRLIVNTNDGSNAPTSLVALQVHTVGIGGKRLTTLSQLVGHTLQLSAGGLQLLSLSHELLNRLLLHGLLLCHACSHISLHVLADAVLHLSRLGSDIGLGIHQSQRHSFKITGKGDAANAIHHTNIIQTSLIGGHTIEQTQTAIDREMIVDLSGSTQLQSEVILLSFHIGIGIVARHSRHAGIERCQTLVEHSRCGHQLLGNGTHGRFERTKSVVELTLSATPGDREIQLPAPIALVPGSLNAGNERSISHSFESLLTIAIVFDSQTEKVVCRCDGTRLVGILPIESQMEALRQEGYAGRIGVHTIEADGSITCRVAKEIDTLVCVGKNATSCCCGGCSQQHAGQECSCFHIL